MVLFDDVEVPQSPINIKVPPSHDAKKARAYGKGECEAWRLR